MGLLFVFLSFYFSVLGLDGDVDHVVEAARRFDGEWHGGADRGVGWDDDVELVEAGEAWGSTGKAYGSALAADVDVQRIGDAGE